MYNTILLEQKYIQINNRPSIIIEGFDELTYKEQQQINEAYNTFYDILIDEGLLGNLKAKVKGAAAGAKAAFSGDENSGNVRTNTQLQSLLDTLKKNIGTYTAQYENDLKKLNIPENDPSYQKLIQLKSTLENSPAKIEVKDTSLGAQAGQFAKDKMLPVAMKAIQPIVKKVEDMYENSGPLKDFDSKFENLKNTLVQKYPDLSKPIQQFSEIAKKNKGKATLIIGALTAILAASGATGPAAPIVLGVGLRGLYGLISGEPPVKSFGKAALTAAAGKLVGGAVNDLFSDVDTSGTSDVVSDVDIPDAEIAADVDKAYNTIMKELETLDTSKGQQLDYEWKDTIARGLARSDSSMAYNGALKKLDLYIHGLESGQISEDQFEKVIKGALTRAEKIDIAKLKA